jgi:hypothetical protein
MLRVEYFCHELIHMSRGRTAQYAFNIKVALFLPDPESRLQRSLLYVHRLGNFRSKTWRLNDAHVCMEGVHVDSPCKYLIEYSLLVFKIEC